jgi:hypothetical protein
VPFEIAELLLDELAVTSNRTQIIVIVESTLSSDIPDIRLKILASALIEYPDLFLAVGELPQISLRDVMLIFDFVFRHINFLAQRLMCAHRRD